ncbi:MAG: hypothetical protein CMH30_06420 [Micavibrio sp.]|nr:hypothetical protein [Micavibrio sp.]|tara:strand:- start:3771 stop:4292 length:522 start_codon:yes stop_codon:yes gene_type:complete
MTYRIGLFSFVFIWAAVIAFSAMASEPRVLSVHGDWTAYVFEENGNKVCYMASQPIKAEGNYSKRGDIFALITHRPAEDSRDVFSYITGYSYKPNSNVTVNVNAKKFTLFTQNDMAWTVDDKTDRDLVQAIRAGNNIIVTGESSRGTKTKDTFSLKGSSAAHDAISRECGLTP